MEKGHTAASNSNKKMCYNHYLPCTKAEQELVFKEIVCQWLVRVLEIVFKELVFKQTYTYRPIESIAYKV